MKKPNEKHYSKIVLEVQFWHWEMKISAFEMGSQYPKFLMQTCENRIENDEF